ncbi:MAG: PTS sugar transporter subunit IIA [Verrucomicrobia bacterium]|nr:PTS sugar transporter subunit IIA [Verrucomicrobiota bacterium]
MNLAHLLAIDRIVPEMKSTEFRGAITELVEHLASEQRPGSITKDTLVEQFLRREELVSTGVGSGVAIPHTFVPGLDRVLTVFGRSREGIDFGAHDDAPVHFVVLFVVPEAEYQLHLRMLGAIAKVFADGEVRQRLAAAGDAGEIREILSKRLARTQGVP